MIGSVTVRVDVGGRPFEFPPSAVAYLRRHKPGQDVDTLCRRQVDRAVKQVDDLRPVLAGSKISSVLDIGCGLAIVDVLLAREFGVRRVHLVDGDGTGERRSDYAEDVRPWNSVVTAQETVLANVSAGVAVWGHLAEPDLCVDRTVDAVVSFKSWGLHYPVRTYLDEVGRCLARGGLLVMDIHTEAEGCAEVLAAGYDLVQTVGEYGETARSIIPFTRHIFRRRG